MRRASVLVLLALVLSPAAWSASGRDLFLEGPGAPPDADVFYRIVAGDLPPETPPERALGRVA